MAFTLSITMGDAKGARLTAAFGKYLNTLDENNVPRPATAAEIEESIRSELKRIVLNMERADAIAAIQDKEF